MSPFFFAAHALAIDMLCTGHNGHHEISPDQSTDGGLRARHPPHLICSLVAALFFHGAACSRERPALNELLTTSFDARFGRRAWLFGYVVHSIGSVKLASPARMRTMTAVGQLGLDRPCNRVIPINQIASTTLAHNLR